MISDASAKVTPVAVVSVDTVAAPTVGTFPVTVPAGISPGETELAQKILFSLSGDSLVMGASAALHREHPGLLRHMAVLAARVAADENRGK